MKKKSSDCTDEALHLFRAAVDISTDNIFLIDREKMRFIDVSENSCRSLGYSREALLSMGPADIMPLFSSADLTAEFDRVIEGVASAGVIETSHRRHDGSQFPVEVNLRYLSSEERDVIIAVARDLTARRHIEKALKTSEERFALAMSVANDGIWDRDMATGEIYFSPRWKALLGYLDHELPNDRQEWIKRLHPEDHDRVMRDMEEHFKGRTSYYLSEYRLRHRDGSYRWIMAKGALLRDETGRPSRFAGCHTDITPLVTAEEEKSRLMERIHQKQKMEMIGTLAGGIAHDFNNILTPIMNCAEIVLDEVPGGSTAAQCLETILMAADRAREMVRRILSLRRNGSQKRTPILLQPLIEESLRLFRPTLPPAVTLKERIDACCGPVMGDAAEIHEVAMNLLTNATHALSGRQGTLTVELREAGQKEILSTADGAIGEGERYLLLSVEDTGVGMAPDVMERIFDPFFSTRKAEKGMGLGLTVVHAIVTGCGGTISVESRPGQGSRFLVCLPGCREAARPSPPERGRSSLKGAERLLLIDDEESILFGAGRILERLGYSVTTRSCGMRALETFRENPQAYDMVITDYTMPGITGIELSREILSVRPGLPVILSSGFNEEVDAGTAEGFGIRGYLRKPFTAANLGEMVRRLLDENKGR